MIGIHFINFFCRNMSVSDIWSPLCFISDFLMGLFANISEQVLAVHVFFLVLLVCIFHLAPLHGKGNAFYMCAFLTSFTFLLPLYVPVFHDKLARYSSLFLLLMVSSHLVLRTKWADLICSVLVCILSHKVSIDRTGPKCSRIQIYCIFPISWKLYYSN